jgi:hypothetical protein
MTYAVEMSGLDGQHPDFTLSPPRCSSRLDRPDRRPLPQTGYSGCRLLEVS